MKSMKEPFNTEIQGSNLTLMHWGFKLPFSFIVRAVALLFLFKMNPSKLVFWCIYEEHCGFAVFDKKTRLITCLSSPSLQVKKAEKFLN